MFGRDPRLPLNTLLQPKIKYMGDEENILSLEALQRIYLLVAENLRLARERMHKNQQPHPTKLRPGDMVMIRTHSEEQFKPLYKGYYRIISFKGNQVEFLKINAKQGKKPKMVHISDVKYVMPADSIIPHLPIPNQFGRMTKYNLNPKNVPDLGWKLSTELNTKSKIVQIHEQIPPKDCIHIDLTQDHK